MKCSTIISTIVAAFVGLVFMAVLVDATGLPEVRFSHETKECVTVIPSGSCDDLPERYIHTWVR